MAGPIKTKDENFDLEIKETHGNPLTEEFPAKLLIRRKTMNRREDSKIIGIVHPIC
jgi:hypothetical protein